MKQFTLFALMLCVGVASAGIWLPQEPVDTVREILSRGESADLSKARQELLAIGDPVIGPVGSTIRSESDATAVRLAFLIGILESINSQEAQWILVTLVDDPRPVVRGFSIMTIERQKITCAVPLLINSLRDQAAFTTQVSTDPYRETPLTVTDAALRALRTITGKPGGPGENDQAKVFQEWWEHEKTRLKCK